ncbi:MAG: hypothetical protein AAGG50_09920 [Bacteroidota bacterium]
MRYRACLLALLTLAGAACDTSADQRDFASEAFLPPNGLGNDDWQIGPRYEAAAFFIDTPPSEAIPVGELLTFTLRVLEPPAFTGGLRLETSFDINGNGSRLDLGEQFILVGLAEYRQGDTQLAVQIDPFRSDPTTGARAFTFPRGAEYRLRVVSRGEVVTYGDVRLAP